MVGAPDDDRDEDPELFDRALELGESRLVEVRARLLRIGLDLRNGDRADRRCEGTLAEQRSQTASQAPADGTHETASNSPSTSRARVKYACAPRLLTSRTITGFPCDGASERRTLRGICVLKTCRGK